MGKRQRSNLPVLLLILGVVMVIVGIKSDQEPETPSHKHTPTRVDAYVMGQQFVLQHLKSPASAEFPVVGDSHTVITGAGNFLTHSYVDSQNGFGAIIRTNYYCELRYHPDTERWELLSLVFPDLNQVFINKKNSEKNDIHPVADTSTPPLQLTPYNLQPGKTYILSREAPLMPELNPIDPMQALKIIKPLHPGYTIHILSIDYNDRNNRWYRVEATSADKSATSCGWVNPLALYGQDLRVVAPAVDNLDADPKNDVSFSNKDYPWKLKVMAKYMFSDPADDYRALMIYRQHNYNELLSAAHRDQITFEILDEWVPDKQRPGLTWYNIKAYNVDDLNGHIQDFTGWIYAGDLGSYPIPRLTK